VNTSSAFRAFRELLPVLRPEWRGMLWSYLLGTASALGLAGLTVLTAWAVGHAVVERTPPGPVWWTLVLGLVLLRVVLTWREMDVSHALAYRVLARLRMALFDAYARSVPGRRREHSGRAAAVAMDDIEKLEFFYAHTVAQLGASLTLFAASFATAFVLLPEAALVMLLGAAVVASSALYGARAARRLGEREQRERSDLSEHIVDALGALREVLAYGLAPRIVAETSAATARAAAIARRRELLSRLVTVIRELILTAVIIGVIATSATAAGVLSEGARYGWPPRRCPRWSHWPWPGSPRSSTPPTPSPGSIRSPPLPSASPPESTAPRSSPSPKRHDSCPPGRSASGSGTCPSPTRAGSRRSRPGPPNSPPASTSGWSAPPARVRAPS
jgi:ABC-type multidrug transport system fused ATPase/permease subunit